MKNSVIVIINSDMQVLVKHSHLYKLSNALMGKIRIDCPCAIAEQGGEMMNVSGLCTFQYY